MIYYAVIDTNVIVSAFLKQNSVPDMILDLALSGVVVPLINDAVLNEYKEVLSRDKFGFDKQLIDDFIEEFDKTALRIDSNGVKIELPDPKDEVFYEIVMTKRQSDDAYLVTGNIKHFPKKSYVVTPREMLDLIVKDNME